jgi:hypothetical protein
MAGSFGDGAIQLHRAQRALIGPEPTVTDGRFRDDNR